MKNQALAQTVVGIIGNVLSLALFIAPLPTFIRICKKKTTEDFHPYPYLACMMNCLFWIFYGLHIVHPDSTLVISINGIGLVLEIVYLSIFFWYTTKKNRRIIALGVMAEAIVLGAIAAITLTCFHTHQKRSMFVGIVCVIFGIIMYGSPLSILKKVVQTRSVEFLPGWLCLAGFLNGITWFTYANLKTFDIYIAIGNGIGGILGFIQLMVYIHYRWGSGAKKAEDVKQSETKNSLLSLSSLSSMKARLFHIFIALLFALLFINIIPSYNNYNDHDQARGYTSMQVVFTWVPTFCASKPKGGCKTPMLIDFTLHGLWPCNSYGNLIMCAPPKPYELDFLYSLFIQLSPGLQAAWPSVTNRPVEGLWYHEYEAHGYCVESKLDAHQYFVAAINWRKRINLIKSFEDAKIFPSDEVTYQKGTLLKAVQDAIDTQNIHQVILSCVKINETHYKLHEVLICIDPTLTNLMSCPIGSRLDECSGNKKIVLPNTINI